MGRTALRSDRKLRPRSFALSDEDVELVRLYAERYDLSQSQAMRRILLISEETLDGEFRRELSLRRRAIGEAARQEAAKPPPVLSCPSCGDKDLYIEYPDGRWRCDNCLATG